MIKKLLVFMAFACAASYAAAAGTCDDLACVRKENPSFAAKFDSSIPLYITRKNAQPLLRLIENKKARKAVETALDMLETRAKQVESRLPAAKPLTCAVVGNSNNLAGSHYGTLIDDHSYVFRMNNAPIENYADDVGKRATHHAIHSAWTVIKNYTPDTVNILYIGNIGGDYSNPEVFKNYQWMVAQSLVLIAQQVVPGAFTNDEVSPSPHFPNNIAKLKGGLRLVHPDFIRHINEQWFTPQNQTPINWPSTGFRTLMVALNLCDKIDVFGFGAPDSKTQKWEHYFPQPGKNTKAHRPDYQEQVLRALEEKHAIRRYMGTEKP